MPKINEEQERTKMIRARVASQGVRYYALAHSMKISYMTLNRWIRCGTSWEHYEKIMTALDKMKGDDPLV